MLDNSYVFIDISDDPKNAKPGTRFDIEVAELLLHDDNVGYNEWEMYMFRTRCGQHMYGLKFPRLQNVLYIISTNLPTNKSFVDIMLNLKTDIEDVVDLIVDTKYKSLPTLLNNMIDHRSIIQSGLYLAGTYGRNIKAYTVIHHDLAKSSERDWMIAIDNILPTFNTRYLHATCNKHAIEIIQQYQYVNTFSRGCLC